MASTAALMALHLVVAWSLAAAVVKVILQDDRFLVGRESFPGAVFGPEFFGRWKGIKREGGFFLHACPGAVVKDKAVAVGREHERDVKGHRIVEGLLHSGADAVVVVLRLDDGDRDIGLVIEDVVGALGFATRHKLPPDDDAPLGKVDLFANLHHPVPARAFHGGADELGADIALAEVFLVHTV